MNKLSLGMVVGEASGENLACGMLNSLQSQLQSQLQFTSFNFSGILGEKLIAAGGEALFPMEKLSLIGVSEVLLRIPELFWIRRRLIQHFLKHRPSIFIGVDAPDFNLGLEKILKQHRIPTVHYVSPTVWAWRQGRIHHIKKAVDLMLALFPFEAKFYEQHQVPVCFTGHPLADEIPIENGVDLKLRSQKARQILGLDLNKPLLALLPGSRSAEIASLGEIYLETAKWCSERDASLQFVVPLVKEQHKAQFLNLKAKIAPELSMLVLTQDSRRHCESECNADEAIQKKNNNTTRLALEACDVVLAKAGTVTLEVMLHKKPMAVCYRVSPLSFQILKRLIQVPLAALPNLLAEEHLVPEFLQEDMKPEIMGQALLALLEGGNKPIVLNRHRSGDKLVHMPEYTKIRKNTSIHRNTMIERFYDLHQLLRRGASDRAAEAIADRFLNNR